MLIAIGPYGETLGHVDGKGKGVPPELQGLCPAHPDDGARFCFHYVLAPDKHSECKGAKPGGKCSIGWHCCPHWGCFGNHTLKEHR